MNKRDTINCYLFKYRTDKDQIRPAGDHGTYFKCQILVILILLMIESKDSKKMWMKSMTSINVKV